MNNGPHVSAPAPARWMVLRVLPLLIVAAIGLGGCGGSSSSGSGSTNPPTHVHFAKTKFLLHAGLAFGAFHRYIYKPFRSGGFTPASTHKLAIVKAGGAALFVYHELKIALVDARSSPVLSKLVSPLTAVETKLNSLRAGLHGGKLDGAAINQANSQLTGVGSQSAHSGATIHDIATKLG